MEQPTKEQIIHRAYKFGSRLASLRAGMMSFIIWRNKSC